MNNNNFNKIKGHLVEKLEQQYNNVSDALYFAILYSIDINNLLYIIKIYIKELIKLSVIDSKYLESNFDKDDLERVNIHIIHDNNKHFNSCNIILLGDGKVTIENNVYAIAFENLKISVLGNSYVDAYNNVLLVTHSRSIISAHNNVNIFTYEQSFGYIFDMCECNAYNNSYIIAFNNSKVVANNTSHVTLFDSAIVDGYDNSIIMNYGDNNAIINIYDNSYLFKC